MLETSIQELTAAVKLLTSVLQSGALPAGAAPAAPGAAAEPTKGTRTRKATDAPAPAAGTTGAPAAQINDGKSVSVKLRQGDAEGTRYFHIPSHNSVAKIAPGEVIPSLPGMLEIGGDEYDTLKAKYAAPVPPAGAGAAAAPASSTSAASSASSGAPATSQQAASGDTGAALLAACKNLHAHLGNDGLAAVLKKFITAANGFDAAAVATPKVPLLVAKTSVHADASAAISVLMALEKGANAAAIDAVLNPAAAAADSGLF